MSFLRFQLERVRLPQPDLLMINHPERGLVLIADPRVSDDAIERLVRVCEARANLHPERMRPRDYADEAEPAATRTCDHVWPLAQYASPEARATPMRRARLS